VTLGEALSRTQFLGGEAQPLQVHHPLQWVGWYASLGVYHIVSLKLCLRDQLNSERLSILAVHRVVGSWCTYGKVNSIVCWVIFLLCVPWFRGGFGLSRYILSVGLFCKLLELIYLLAPSMLYSSSMLLNNLVRDNGCGSWIFVVVPVCDLVACNAKVKRLFLADTFPYTFRFVSIYLSLFSV